MKLRAFGSVSLAVALTLVAAACSSSKHGNSPTPAATPSATAEAPVIPDAVSTAPARPSPGCTGIARFNPGVETHTLSVSGIDRTYRSFVPDTGGSSPEPIVINLHGLTSNVDQQVAISAYEQLAATENFIVLTPQALGTPSGWNINDASPGNRDIAFINAMLDDVESGACADLARVYSSGISDGGIFSGILACALGQRIAAIGVVSGIRRPAGCDPGHPVPLMIFWGKDDVVLPFCGGLGPALTALLAGKPLDSAPPPTCPPANLAGFPPVEDAVNGWATANGCELPPRTVTAGSDVEERIYGGCAAGGDVRFFVVADGGHTWPGSKLMEAISATAASRLIGHTTDQVDATAAIWAFFRAFALPPPP